MSRQNCRQVVLIFGLMVSWHATVNGQADDSRVAADRHGDPLPAGTVARLGTLRFRHGHFITSIAFSPDGKSVATTDSNRILRLWDAATGQERRRFGGQSGPFAGAPAVFSPDGRILVAGDGQKNLLLWEAATGKELHRYPGRGCATCQAFSPDGQCLALSDYDGTLILLEAATGKVLRTFAGHTQRVERVAFSPDGRLLASAGLDATVRIWETTSGKQLRQLAGHKLHVEALAFSPDGKLLASGGGFGDSSIILFEVPTGAEVRRFKADDSSWGLTQLAFSPDGRLLASAGGDQTNRLWDPTTGQEVRRFNRVAKGTSVRGCVAFSPDGKVLAGRGQHDTVLCLWDVATGRELGDFAAHASAIQAVAISPDGTRIASGAKDGSVFLWESGTGQLLQRSEGHADSVLNLSFTPDGRLLASLGADQAIQIRETQTGRAQQSISAANGRCVAFAPDGRTLAVGHTGGTVTIWETASGKQLRQFQTHPFRFDPDGERYVAPVSALAFAPDGKTLATGLDTDLEQREEVFYLYDLATTRLVRRIQVPPGDRDNCRHSQAALAFSPDGKTLITGSGHKLVRLWEVATGKERRRLAANNVPGPNNWPYSVAFSPDAQLLVSWGHQNSLLRLWDLTTGRELSPLRGHQGYVYAAAFAANGRRLVSGSEDTTALVWNVADLLPAAPVAVQLSVGNLEALWKDLAGDDAAQAQRAILTLSASGPQAVLWLRDRLQPAAPVERERIQRLIADLDSDRFDVRQQAAVELAQLGDQAESALNSALAAKPSLEVRRRVELLLEKLVERMLTTDQLRFTRSIEVLERIGSPQAQQVLQKLAAGAAEVRSTGDAQAAWQRLARRTFP